MLNVLFLKYALFAVMALFLSQTVRAQYTSTKVKDKNEQYVDSLKQVDYDYTFPIWGQKAYEKGFDIPYPVGIMSNFIYLRQGIIIDNMQLGLLTSDVDIPLTGVDFIEFGNNISTAYSVNIRPDIWVFPFLNVYGLFGVGSSETEVNLVAPIALQSIVKQSLTTYGLGMMTAVGLGPVWLSLDFNVTWSKPELLDKPVKVVTTGFRFGHSFVFKEKPYRNLAIWAGGMYLNMESETVGQIALNDVISDEAWMRRDEIVDNYNNWYDNEATIAEKVIADKVLTPIVERIEAADGSAIIRYGMDKQVKQNWNAVVGAQYQFNKKWMLRTEFGVIGDRKSYLASLNYRFLW